MIALKLIAVAAGTAVLVSAFSEDFGSDLILAIVTCLS
jgi:hypothetical protein